MPTITIKNIPNDLYEKLKKTAHEHRRSINSEIIMCIERNVSSRRVQADDFLKRLETIQRQISLPPLTDQLLLKAKQEGRL